MTMKKHRKRDRNKYCSYIKNNTSLLASILGSRRKKNPRQSVVIRVFIITPYFLYQGLNYFKYIKNKKKIKINKGKTEIKIFKFLSTLNMNFISIKYLKNYN